ncbi:MAG: SUMF1/EgtB/PvdO family nonheme iron enzyme [Acidobacteriota bacterium]
MPDGDGDPGARKTELRSHLLGLVRRELTELRGGEEFSNELVDELDALRSDFAQGSARREAWSALYFRHFCPHRPGIDQLIGSAAVSRRTFHRRLSAGLAALAELLSRNDGAALAPGAAETTSAPPLSETLVPLHLHLLEGGPSPGPEALETALRETPSSLLEYLLVRWARRTRELAQLRVPFLELPVQGPAGSDRAWSSLEEAWQAIGDHLLVLGAPGGGKTTALLHLERLLLEESLTSGVHRVPLALRLGLEWQPDDATGSPWETVERRWEQQHPHLPSLSELQAAGRLVVIADGLNEIPAADPTLRHRSIDAWARSFAALSRDGCRLVVSCRELELDRPLRTAELDFLTVHLGPPELAAVRQVVEQRLPPTLSPDWLAQAELLRHPLLLDLLLSEADHGARAASQEALLTSFLRHRLREGLSANVSPSIGRHDRLRLNLDRWANPWELPSSSLLTALERLAWTLHGGDGSPRRWSLPLERALTELAPDGGAEAESLLDRAVTMGVLLMDLEAREVSFVHPLFQDYFVARELVRQPRLELVERAWRHDEVTPPLTEALAATPEGEALSSLTTTGWEEATVMATVMAGDPEQRLRELADARLDLAADVADRLGRLDRVKDETRLAIAELLVDRTRDLDADLRERVEIGRALGRLGDPRLSEQHGPHGDYRLPPLATIPTSEILLGETEGRADELERVVVESFRLATLPVTVDEWNDFIIAGGHEDPLFWPGDEARRWQAGVGTGAARRQELLELHRRYREDPASFEETLRAGVLDPGLLEQVVQRRSPDDDLQHELLARHPDRPRRPEPNGTTSELTEPISSVSFQEARAYAHWLSVQTGRRFRLPTEAELWATHLRPPARSPRPEQALGNVRSTRLAGRVPVGLFPDSDTTDGVMDLVGNVRVWTTTSWGSEQGRPMTGRQLTEAEPLTLLTTWGSSPTDDGPVRVEGLHAGATAGLRLAEDD